MNRIFLLLAAAVSGITTLAHIVIGGPKNAAPIFDRTDLPTGPKVTVEFAWHAASVFLFFVTAIFLWAAVKRTDRTLVLFTVTHCAVLSILGAAVSYTGGLLPWAFPPSVLFALIVVFGFLAVYWPKRGWQNPT